jgi:hypothetical protein
MASKNLFRMRGGWWTHIAKRCGDAEGENPEGTDILQHNLAQNVTALNIYMLFGGTNWGNIGIPEVGTSYDYSAPI